MWVSGVHGMTRGYEEEIFCTDRRENITARKLLTIREWENGSLSVREWRKRE